MSNNGTVRLEEIKQYYLHRLCILSLCCSQSQRIKCMSHTLHHTVNYIPLPFLHCTLGHKKVLSKPLLHPLNLPLSSAPPSQIILLLTYLMKKSNACLILCIVDLLQIIHHCTNKIFSPPSLSSQFA